MTKAETKAIHESTTRALYAMERIDPHRMGVTGDNIAVMQKALKTAIDEKSSACVL